MKTAMVHVLCECGGEFLCISDPSDVQLSNSSKYPHLCTRCQANVYLDGQYPRIELIISSQDKGNHICLTVQELNNHNDRYGRGCARTSTT